MSNPNKAKGSRWESEVRDYLADRLPYRVERIPAGAALDRGDLTGVPGVAIECKNEQKHDLAGWVEEATVEARNVGEDVLPVVVAKRRGKGAADGYVVMPVWAWVEFLRRQRDGG